MTRIRPTALLIAVAAAFPAAASADSPKTYCVNNTDCVFKGGGEYEPSIQAALNDAAGHPGLDHVRITPGVYPDGPFTYIQNSNNPVDIAPTSPGKIILGLTAGSKSSYAVEVSGGGSTVSDITVSLPPKANNIIGLDLYGGVTAEHVTVNVADESTLITAIDITDGGTLRDAQVHARHSAGAIGIAAGANLGPVEISDARVDAPTGLRIGGGSAYTSTVRRLVTNGTDGILAYCGHTIVEDSLVVADTNGITANGCAGKSQAVEVRQSTVIGGGGGDYGAQATGGGADSASLTLSNSIVRGYKTALYRQAVSGAHVNLATSYSGYDPARVTDVSANGIGALVQDHQIAAAPDFVDATEGDFHLRPGSSLVDAGDPAGLSAGEAGTDLEGHQRIQGGRRDVGAYESTPAAAQQPGAPGTPGGSGPGGPGNPGGGSSDPAPHVTLAGAKSQRLGKRGRLTLTATSDRDARLAVTTTLRIKGLKKALALKPRTLQLTAGHPAKITLTLSGRALKALRGRAKLSALVRAVATGSGGSGEAKRTLRLAL
jgi:hypothetical protein